MTTHHLKSWPSNFAALKRGDKDFEIRENDRDYQIGDLLVLKEFVPYPPELQIAPPGKSRGDVIGHPAGYFTGNQEVRWIKHMLVGDGSGVFGLQKGFVILGLRKGLRVPDPLDEPFVEDNSAVVRDLMPAGLKPLTDHERELLDILSEECAEVIIQISKLKRFGRVGIDSSVFPAMRYDNIALLGMEVGHLQHMINVVQAFELIYPGSVMAGTREKGEKLMIYLQTKHSGIIGEGQLV